MSSIDVNKWVDYEGEKFLRTIGIQRDQFVLDFGCRYGIYSLPAAKLVGLKGKIYAVDKNREYLDELLNKAKKIGLNNIEAVLSLDEMLTPIDDQYIDVVLLYDVLHLIDNRKKLLNELYRVLKIGGVFSVYPKHHKTIMNMGLKEVKKEIEDAGFHFDVKIIKSLMHDDKLEKGYVLNFRKKMNLYGIKT